MWVHGAGQSLRRTPAAVHKEGWEESESTSSEGPRRVCWNGWKGVIQCAWPALWRDEKEGRSGSVPPFRPWLLTKSDVSIVRPV